MYKYLNVFGNLKGLNVCTESYNCYKLKDENNLCLL